MKSLRRAKIHDDVGRRRGRGRQYHLHRMEQIGPYRNLCQIQGNLDIEIDRDMQRFNLETIS